MWDELVLGHGIAHKWILFTVFDILRGGGQGRVTNKKRSFLRARHGLADRVSCHGEVGVKPKYLLDIR